LARGQPSPYEKNLKEKKTGHHTQTQHTGCQLDDGEREVKEEEAQGRVVKVEGMNGRKEEG
jgi:hypothetical protein